MVQFLMNDGVGEGTEKGDKRSRGTISFHRHTEELIHDITEVPSRNTFLPFT